MNITRFNFGEMYSNSSGKTSASLVAAHALVLTGCIMGVRGALILHSESMLQGLAFATLGAGLLGLRRFTDDKKLQENAEKK